MEPRPNSTGRVVPPDVIRRFVDDLEPLRLGDLSFRDDPQLAPLPAVTKAGELSRYLLLAACIDVGVNSNDIRPFLHALHGRLQDRSRGLFDLASGDDALVLETIADEQ